MISQVHVSNSVISWPSVVAWHPSGQYFILTDVAWGDGALGFLSL